MDLSDKVVFVTGGSRGIGLAASRLFAQKGAHVALFARDAQKLENAALEVSQCRARESQRVFHLSADVSDRVAVSVALEQAVAHMGVPDVLFNCAGRALPRAFEEVSFAQFDETIKINLYGTWNTVTAMAPLMKGRGGVIVNTASVAGLVGVFGYTDYCASKFAIIGFSEALRGELSPHGVRVQVLCPPDTDTPGFACENQTKPEETRAISANAKLLSAQDVANALVRGMGGGSFLIIPGFDGKLTWLTKRLFPSLVSYVMDRAVTKVQQTGKDGKT